MTMENIILLMIIDCCHDCEEKIAKLFAEHIGYYDLEKDVIVRK